MIARIIKHFIFFLFSAFCCGVWPRHAWFEVSVVALFRGARTKSVYRVTCWTPLLCIRMCVLIALCFFFGSFQDGFVQNLHIPMVRVDPENRCAVMLVYGTCLVVLPFRKDTLTDEQEGIVGEGYGWTFSKTRARGIKWLLFIFNVKMKFLFQAEV